MVFSAEATLETGISICVSGTFLVVISVLLPIFTLAKANLKIQEKIKSYETILGENFANDDKSIVADYKVMLPIEMYKSYQAYNTATTFFQRSSNINTSEKNTTQFYQSVPIKEFDFVVNPVILEPVIQVMYEIKLLITKKPKTNPETPKEYYILTANGDLKKVNIKP